METQTIQGVKTHHTTPVRNKWKDPKPVVTPNLTLSVNAMLARLKQGLPSTIPTRTIESYYKNLDLEDIRQLNEDYLKKSHRVQKVKEQIDQAKEKANKEQNKRQKQIMDFIAAQKQQQQSIGTENGNK